MYPRFTQGIKVKYPLKPQTNPSPITPKFLSTTPKFLPITNLIPFKAFGVINLATLQITSQILSFYWTVQPSSIIITISTYT